MALDEIIHYIWDPIGVADEPGARDEYYGYLPQIEKSVIDGRSVEFVAHLLGEIAQKRMGLPANKQHNQHVAELIFRWYKALH